MSSFKCEHCGTVIADSDHGYITECPHYPFDKVRKLAWDYKKCCYVEVKE